MVYYQGRVKPRESLIETLWPELEPEKSANLFRVTCTYLRSALAEHGYSDVLLREMDGYKINTEILDCDLFHFRQEARSILSMEMQELTDLSNLYSGEFLEGKRYDWAISARAQLESEFIKIQHCLSDGYFAHELWDKSLEVLERVLLYDSCEEETVMRVINIKIQKGEQASARKIYQEFEKKHIEEFGITPTMKFPLRG